MPNQGIADKQTEEPEDKNRPSNLWSPLPGDHGAHGRFDNRAQDSSVQLWATQNQNMLALALGAGVACVGIGAYLGSKSQPKQSPAVEDDENEITESEIKSEVLRQMNRTREKDQFQTLMGLARLGWKAFSPNTKPE